MLKSALIACMAFMAGLAGCSKDLPGEIGNGEKTVRIQIPRSAVTRAAGQHVAEKTTVVVNDAAIYFTSAGGNIMETVLVDCSETPAEGAVTMAALEAGVEFTNLPGSITAVYVVANSPVAYAQTNVSAFAAADAITLASQADIEDVALYGMNTLGAPVTPATPTTNAKYSVEITIAPVVARFEIGSIAANWNKGGMVSTVTAFDLDGIFLDNYYTTMSFDGAAKSASVPGSVVPSHYVAANFPVQVSDLTAFHAATGVARPAYVAKEDADENTVWAYNLLAPRGGGMPSLVIRLSDVVVETNDAVTYAGDKFLNIKNILDGDGKKITVLEAGKVYRLKELSFAEDHLTDNPNQNLIDVTVIVTVLPWDSVEVGYDFGN